MLGEIAVADIKGEDFATKVGALEIEAGLVRQLFVAVIDVEVGVASCQRLEPEHGGALPTSDFVDEELVLALFDNSLDRSIILKLLNVDVAHQIKLAQLLVVHSYHYRALCLLEPGRVGPGGALLELARIDEHRVLNDRQLGLEVVLPVRGKPPLRLRDKVRVLLERDEQVSVA
jgi:hypothetical protein